MKISPMKFVATIVALILILLSCGRTPEGDSSENVKDSSTVKDTVVIIKDSIAADRSDSLFSGAYQGIFPCPDCDGIQQTILFNADKTYKQEQVLWGKNLLPKIQGGTWKFVDGKIEMMQNGKPAIELVKNKDTLYAVSIDGIQVNHSSKYFLTKRTLARENPIWVKKQKEGVDFDALGNEPFWSLEIDKQKSISFKLADWKKPITVPAEKPVIVKDSTIYTLKSDTTKWTITIFPEFCNDGMSDYLYQYKVNVNYNGVKYKGCGVVLSK